MCDAKVRLNMGIFNKEAKCDITKPHIEHHATVHFGVVANDIYWE